MIRQRHKIRRTFVLLLALALTLLAGCAAKESGERFDPAESGNELSCTVLRKSVEELRYSFDPAREMANSVCVRIREKP